MGITGKNSHTRARPATAATPALHYNGAVEEEPQRRVLRAETLGLLVVALVILAIVLLWSGNHIDWRAR